MKSFMLEAIIIKKLSQKVRMPVTEHNATVKIAFSLRKYCKKIQFIIVKIVKIQEPKFALNSLKIFDHPEFLFNLTLRS